MPAKLSMLLAAAASLAACRREPEETPSPGAVRIGLTTRPISFDPHSTTELVALSVNSNVYESLVRLDADLRPRPLLAASWYSMDELTWTFDLVSGVRFHDGSPLEARDVAYSLLRARDDPHSEWAASLTTIRSVETPSRLRVVVRTRMPDVTLVTGLASILVVPADAGAVAVSPLGTRPVGSGPYRLVSAGNGDAAVELEAWEGYRGGRPRVSRLAFWSVPEDAARVAGLLEGRFELVAFVPAREAASIERVAGYRVVERPGLLEVYLGFDHVRDRTPYASPPENPFRDRRVRQAITLAVDRRQLVEDVLGRAGVEANQLVAPGVFGWDPDLPALRPDPARARELLAEAGYPQGFSVVLDAPADSFVGDARVGPFVSRSLAAVGVDVTLRSSSKPELFRRWAEQDTSFFVGGWSCTSGDLQEVLDYLLHTPEPSTGHGGENVGGYSNPELDRLSELARGSTRHSRRLGALREAARLALDDVAWAPLYVPSDRYGISGALDWSPRRDQLILGAEMAFAAPGRTAAIGEGPFRLFAAALVGAGLAISGYYRARSARARGALGPGGRGVVLIALRLVGGAALLPLAAYLVHPPWVSWARVPIPPELRWLAGLAGIGLLALLVWILRSLGLNLGPSHETRQGHTLVTSGPYRFVRHPLYATGALLSVVLGLLAGLWWPLVWLVPGLLLLMWRTPKEEARLVEVFGDGYRDYMRRTGRYLPRIGRR